MGPKTNRRGALLAIVLAALSGCQKGEEVAPQSAKSAPQAAAPSGGPTWAPPLSSAWARHEGKTFFKTPWQNECEWMGSLIVRDIAEMAHFARTKQVPPEGAFSVLAAEAEGSKLHEPVYEVSIDGPDGNQRLAFAPAEGFWSPETYARVCAPLLGGLGFAKPAEPAEEASALLSRLLDADLAALEAESGKLSAELNGNFLSPELHARAAIVLATLGLLEASGRFNDQRAILCRIAAHMTMARAFGADDSSRTYHLAETLRLTLENSQVRALERLPVLERSGAPWSDWALVMKLRCTGDQRLVPEEPPAATLPRLECARAWAMSVSPSHAAVRVGAPANGGERWLHVLANNDDFGVGVGRLLEEEWWGQATAQAKSQYAAFFGEPLPPGKRLAEHWNHLPGSYFDGVPGAGREGRVLSWATWSLFWQRHFANAAILLFAFCNDSWAVPEAAEEWRVRAERDLAGMWLNEFVRAKNYWTEADYRRGVDATFDVIRAHPETVPNNAWSVHSDARNGGFAMYTPDSPHANEWCNVQPIPGTAYDIRNRGRYPSLTDVGPDPLANMKRMQQRAPYDGEVANRIIRKRYPDGEVPASEAIAVLGSIAEYNAMALRKATTVVRSADKFDMYVRLGRIHPEYNAWVAEAWGDKLSSEEFDRLASSAYDLAADRVEIAKRSKTFVARYLAEGKMEKARLWAEMGEDVGSAYGYEAYALYQEANGNWEEALRTLGRLAERYGNPGPMIACVRRGRVAGAPGMAELEKRLVGAVFPDGMKQVALADLSGPPRAGVLVAEDSYKATAAGMKRGDIIVAANGVAVANFAQYAMARDLTAPEPFELFVFREGKYFAITANPPDRRFGVDMPAYRP